jgi:hypothetical protein
MLSIYKCIQIICSNKLEYYQQTSFTLVTLFKKIDVKVLYRKQKIHINVPCICNDSKNFT